MGLVPRAKVTRGAHKWLLSRVRPEVPRQSTLVCCSIVALAARKRLFARVYAHVLVERRFLCRAVCGDVGKTGGECVGGEHVEFCMRTRSTMQWSCAAVHGAILIRQEVTGHGWTITLFRTQQVSSSSQHRQRVMLWRRARAVSQHTWVCQWGYAWRGPKQAK